MVDDVLLNKVVIIERCLMRRMQAMVGFRNIAVHNYQKLSLEVVRSILNENLDDFRRFCAAMLESSAPN